MKKTELKAKLKSLVFKNAIEENSLEFFKSMPKKELKAYINEYGGFTKGKVQTLGFNPDNALKDTIPEGAFTFEAVLSDDSLNMNGYRILLSAWQEGFEKYFSDYEGLVYLQHDMDQPIGKTLDIAVDEEQKVLYARGFAYDDLTDKRISRGLVRDISTGHLPLEIKYINKDTQEEKTPKEFFELLWDMVDRLRDEGEEWDKIQEAINGLYELRIETHTKVQIIEYSFVSVGANKQAEVKKINNSLEKIENELKDIEIEREEAKEDNENKTDTETSENDLENEGGTPEASEDITAPENGEEEDSEAPTADTSENEVDTEEDEEKKALKSENETLKARVNDLEEEKKKLSAEIEEFKTHNNSRIVLIKSNATKQDLIGKTDEQIKVSINKLL